MDMLVTFFLVGGWILLVPAFFVLGCTTYVLIGNAVERRRARKDGDVNRETNFIQP